MSQSYVLSIFYQDREDLESIQAESNHWETSI